MKYPLLRAVSGMITAAKAVPPFFPEAPIPTPVTEKAIKEPLGLGAATGLGVISAAQGVSEVFLSWGERIGAVFGSVRNLLEDQKEVTEEVSSATEKASQETVAFAKQTLKTMKTFANKQEKLSAEIGLLRRQIRGLRGAR